jgi:DNA-binding transcriptional ArsR family regulator
MVRSATNHAGPGSGIITLMKDGPHIVAIASLIGERARADILTALMGGQALTATELAGLADVTKQTVSAHLAKLVDARLLAVESQGRHRYFRLADDDVAQLLESIMGVAYRAGAVRLKSSPREPALRKARVCYDHLAGDLGVFAFERFEKRRFFRHDEEGLRLAPAGERFFEDLGVDLAARESRRPACRVCLDWSERRHHLAGSVGAALLARVYDLGWAKREPGTRVVRFSASGESAFRERIS